MNRKLTVIFPLVLLLCACCVNAQNKTQQVTNSIAKNLKKYNGQQYCPSVEFFDTSGTKVRLDQFKGKNILVNLWFIGCMPCFSEIPFERELQKRFADDTTFMLLNICVVPANMLRWKQFIKYNNMAGQHLMMDESVIDSLGTDKTGQLLRARSFPTYILLNSSLKIIGYELPEPSSEIQLDYIIDHLKSGRTVPELYKEVMSGLQHFDAKNTGSTFYQWMKEFYKQDPVQYFTEKSR
jgi:thiol-disulfide isomerase/thioredoxin